jgi:hypothetical protein
LSNETVRLNNLINNNQVSSGTTKELAHTVITSVNSFDESIQRLVNCTQDSLRYSEEANRISQDIDTSSIELLRETVTSAESLEEHVRTSLPIARFTNEGEINVSRID